MPYNDDFQGQNWHLLRAQFSLKFSNNEKQIGRKWKAVSSGETPQKRGPQRWAPTLPSTLLSVGTATLLAPGWAQCPSLMLGLTRAALGLLPCAWHISLLGFMVVATQDFQFLPEEWPLVAESGAISILESTPVWNQGLMGTFYLLEISQFRQMRNWGVLGRKMKMLQ